MKRTANNLMIGFIKESQTRIRYEIYAEIAKKENYSLIFRIFKDFANQKKEHANWFYKTLQQLKNDEVFEDLTVEIKNPTTYGTTIQNLESSIEEEDKEWQDLYPNFINVAKMEDYQEIAKILKKFIQTKRNHSQRLKMLLNLANRNAFFKGNKITYWTCLACGYEVAMDELPNDFNCPSCGHFKSYFQRKVLQLIPDEKSIEQKEISGWVCMECGYEVALEELPEDWKCFSCGRSKAYFKRKVLKPKNYIIKPTETEKAQWVCLECGNEEEIDMPVGWRCPKCGFPNK
ncbi:MAG: ferritin family protein [Candidatus Hodarchaeota archaeon]